MGLSRSISSWCIAAVVAVLFAFGTRAKADAYYNATPVAGLSPVQFAAIYPVSPPAPLTTAQQAELPGVNGELGLNPRTPTFFQMHAQFANSEGTVIGVVPNGASLGEPWSSTGVGYAQLQANGQYGPYVPLSSNYGAEAFINNNNQILLTGAANPEIIDLNKGTTTDFASLVSPATTQQYGILLPYGIADNGAILAQYGDDLSHPSLQWLVLTPPGVPLEVPAPEPTALVTIVLGLAGMALRSRRKKS
jgi:hypothetical protein